MTHTCAGSRGLAHKDRVLPAPAVWPVCTDACTAQALCGAAQGLGQVQSGSENAALWGARCLPELPDFEQFPACQAAGFIF